jgi:hypothetical protein
MTEPERSAPTNIVTGGRKLRKKNHRGPPQMLLVNDVTINDVTRDYITALSPFHARNAECGKPVGLHRIRT